jgi:hypothetical protein
MHRKRKERLTKMMEEYTLARFESPFEPGWTHGYVVDVGPDWALLLLVEDGCRFDGFACHRIADIKKLKPDPYADFTEAALRLRGEEVLTAPTVDLKEIAKLLRSVAKVADVVTIHRETVDPDVCWIGALTKVKGKECWLMAIGPDAVWNKKATIFPIAEITRVEWGGAYEEALMLVGKRAPRV